MASASFSSNPMFSGLGRLDEEDSGIGGFSSSLLSQPQPIVHIAETGWYVQVKETNYQRDQTVPVQGKMSIGELTLKVVEEIGKPA